MACRTTFSNYHLNFAVWLCKILRSLWVIFAPLCSHLFNFQAVKLYLLDRTSDSRVFGYTEKFTVSWMGLIYNQCIHTNLCVNHVCKHFTQKRSVIHQFTGYLKLFVLYEPHITTAIFSQSRGGFFLLYLLVCLNWS